MADGIWCVDDEVQVCGEGRTTDVVCGREWQRIMDTLDRVAIQGADRVCTLEAVLLMGFEAIGWAAPHTAAYDMLDAIATAVCNQPAGDG
ncbi:hypothetical protein ACRAVF_26975 [Bradyrhizobium oligotrophicum S58]